jgi:protein transport protein HofC
MTGLSVFIWQGTAARGQTQWGISLAKSAPHLTILLEQQHIATKRQWRAPQRLLSKHIQHQTGYIFTQLADLLQAHLTLPEALQILASTEPNSTSRHFCLLLLEGINEGHSLGQCCLQMQMFCPPLTGETLMLSEHHAQLPQGLSCVAWSQQQSKLLAQQISSALRYPLWLFSATTIAATAMCTWVLPPLAELLRQTQPHTHLATAFRGALLLAQHPYQTWITVLVALFCLNRLKSSQCAARAPWVKKIVKKATKQRQMARLLMIAKAQLPWAQGIALLAHRSNNAASNWQRVHHKLLQGSPLHQALKTHPDFSRRQCAQIQVAERCGRTIECLSSLVEQQKQETIDAMTDLKQLMEPLLTIFMGGVVGSMMWLFYAPLINLGDQLWMQ